MNSKSRTYNVIFNIFTNLGAQIITIIINFLTRIVFIKTFGENYLGINGLFSNILSVLSLAELGINGAMIYSMYKPIAEKDYHKITALMNYYKKLYTYIGLFVVVLGISLIPFLKYLVNIPSDIGNVTYYYLLYLVNTVVSYFLVYRTSILIADQKNYIIKICNICTVIFQFLALSYIAYAVKEYYVYLSTQIIFLIINNFICSNIAVKMYPFIREKAELTKAEKKSIWNNIWAMFSYQVGNVILNNTDNILISVIVNTIAVGYYSNYSMIIMSISALIQLIFTSMQASIGNLVVSDDNNRQYDIFKVIKLMSFWITSFSSVSFAVLLQDCISLLFSDSYLLDFNIVIVCVFNFYIVNILYPVYCYRNTVGLFKETKMVMIFTSIVNIILSVILGFAWGLFGILVSTGIARILTNFWYEPVILYKKYFKKDVKTYFIDQLFYFIGTCGLITLSMLIAKPLNTISILPRFLLKICVCIIIPNTCLLALFGRNKECKYLLNMIKGKVR